MASINLWLNYMNHVAVGREGWGSSYNNINANITKYQNIQNLWNFVETETIIKLSKQCKVCFRQLLLNDFIYFKFIMYDKDNLFMVQIGHRLWGSTFVWLTFFLWAIFYVVISCVVEKGNYNKTIFSLGSWCSATASQNLSAHTSQTS